MNPCFRSDETITLRSIHALKLPLHFCKAMLSSQLDAQSHNADNELTKGDVSPVE